MSKENIKISKEELEVKKALYKQILDKEYYFFWSLKKRFEKEENQVPKKAFIDIVKTWLAIYEVEFEVKRFQIIFGNQDRDGWTYIYDWRTGEYFSRVSHLLDEEEMAKKNAKLKAERDKKIAKKLEEFGLDGKYIGTVFQNKDLPDVKIKWLGIALDRSKWPIKFYDMRDKKEKVMILDYFKSHYYYIIKENENVK